MKSIPRRLSRALAIGGGLAAIAALAVTAQDRPDRAPPGLPGLDAPEIFAKIDTDGDDRVTREEARAFRAVQFAQADRDGDGVVTRDELAASQRARIEAQLRERARRRAEATSGRMMARLDRDGDGSLTAEEMTAPGADGLFAMADRDGDGVVTRRETRKLRHSFRRPARHLHRDERLEGPFHRRHRLFEDRTDQE
ncbi:MAG: hypothetical protein AAGC92_07030 [Pseudomonadota bacterium]